MKEKFIKTEVPDLIGQTVLEITKTEDTITFIMGNDTYYKLYHDQD